MGEPDPFRMKYRALLTEIIREVVLQGTGPYQDVVDAWAAEHLPEVDGPRFITLVNAELHGLHEGNIARFRLRPKEFAAWQDAAQQKKSKG